MTLALISIAHFLVDGVCVSSLFGYGVSNDELALALIVYNSLAFSTQCIIGAVIDRTGRAKDLGRIAMMIVAAGCLIPSGIMIKAVIAGLGNSLFHVTCGSMTIMRYRGRPEELGIFVAPGAFGVSLGMLFPSLRIWLAAALILIGALTGHAGKDDFDYNRAPEKGSDSFPAAEVLFLTAAVMVRAIGGSAVSFSWQKGAGAALLMTAFVFAGKFLGGFALSRLGTVKTVLISIIPAAICIAFFSAYALPSLVGQFLLNLTMPVTLFMLVRVIPDSPGLAFGLAASALWPGTLIGSLFTLTGPALWLCVIISMLFGLVAVLFCERRFDI